MKKTIHRGHDEASVSEQYKSETYKVRDRSNLDASSGHDRWLLLMLLPDPVQFSLIHFIYLVFIPRYWYYVRSSVILPKKSCMSTNFFDNMTIVINYYIKNNQIVCVFNCNALIGCILSRQKWRIQCGRSTT